MDYSDELHSTVAQLAQALQQRGWMMATAESCTGGMIAAACTDLPGSSAWFDRGFVTYSNMAKTEMLGVSTELIAQHGAVSEKVVLAMTQGACERSAAKVSIAVSGIAGPGGATPEKPVGTVWLGWQIDGQLYSRCMHWSVDRSTVRQKAQIYALQILVHTLQTSTAPATS